MTNLCTRSDDVEWINHVKMNSHRKNAFGKIAKLHIANGSIKPLECLFSLLEQKQQICSSKVLSLWKKGQYFRFQHLSNHQMLLYPIAISPTLEYKHESVHLKPAFITTTKLKHMDNKLKHTNVQFSYTRIVLGNDNKKFRISKKWKRIIDNIVLCQ